MYKVVNPTAVVGWACLNYHKLYRRPRGMFFSAKDVGCMVSGLVALLYLLLTILHRLQSPINIFVLVYIKH